ncbi:hypothetical protein GI374_07180 [Paracoccus sp. S-4012]|uniref:hypothetical protein n=1 Tax=Paracoccus sp. S-4012 TaxID=2665648 RepID=UPI0012AF99F2|nr:hypothetical protein [Paracoccus sp. S-4012]MRX50231.1 hypothetical protein [Paracoccus sp. S-4012]
MASTKGGPPQGTKTHQQQLDIIEGRVDTSNEDKDFNPRPYLNASKGVRARIDETDLPEDPTPVASEDGNPAPQGENQESQHHKNSGKPADQKR